MIKIMILTLLFISCNDETTGGSSAPDLDSTRGSVSEGRLIYGNNCVECHGDDATGVTNLGSDITNVRINRLYDVLTFDGQVPDMRDLVGQFRDEDIEDIAAYLETFRETLLRLKKRN